MSLLKDTSLHILHIIHRSMYVQVPLLCIAERLRFLRRSLTQN